MRRGNFEVKGRPIVKYSLSAVSCAKTAEPIEMKFGILRQVDPENHVLDEGAHWRHLTNTTEPSMCGGDATLCQSTLTTCYY